MHGIRPDLNSQMFLNNQMMQFNALLENITNPNNFQKMVQNNEMNNAMNYLKQSNYPQINNPSQIDHINKSVNQLNSSNIPVKPINSINHLPSNNQIAPVKPINSINHLPSNNQMARTSHFPTINPNAPITPSITPQINPNQVIFAYYIPLE